MRRALPAIVVPAALVALVALGPVEVLGRPAAAPRPPAGADRLHRFSVNLDRDSTREIVLVYSRTAPGTGSFVAPETWFSVWDHRSSGWTQVQRVRVAQAQGSTNGLRDAWLGDLNRDGRVEIAATSLITPSVGTVLSVYHQTGRRVARFRRLQVLGGDGAAVVPRRRAAAEIIVRIRSNHSSDNRAHRERWRWDRRRDRWTCRADCMPRG